MRTTFKTLFAALAVLVMAMLAGPAPEAKAFGGHDYQGSRLTHLRDSCHVRRYEYGTRYRWTVKQREAKYRWRDQKIMIRPPVYAKVKTKHGWRKTLVHAAVYRQVSRRILVAPAKNLAIRHARKRYWPLPTEIRRAPGQVYAFGRCW